MTADPSQSDPFRLLGLTREATLDEVRRARRSLARAAYPDVGGDERRMQELNAAFEAAVAHVTGRRPLPPVAAPDVAPTRSTSTGGSFGRRRRVVQPPFRRHVQYDTPSFTMDALPAEAFEALLVVTSWIGEVLVDDPPYVLEAFLSEPSPCWCRLELLPDAGASTVNLVVAPVEGQAAPEADDVRDVWVANLNRLGTVPP